MIRPFRTSHATIFVLFLLILPALSNAQTAQVNFQVNMQLQESIEEFDPATDVVAVKGSWNSWGLATQLSDDDSNHIHTGERVCANGTFAYKFVILEDGDPGNIIWESRDDRSLVVGDSEIDLPLVWFNDVQPELDLIPILQGQTVCFSTTQFLNFSNTTSSPVTIELFFNDEFVQTLGENILESPLEWYVDILDFGFGYQLAASMVFDGITYSDSTAQFTIGQPIYIYAPEGGAYEIGSSANIMWAGFTPTPVPTSLNLLLDDEFVESIATDITGASQYSWTVGPNAVDIGYTIEAVIQYEEMTFRDTTQAPFSLLNPIHLTSPNGGELLTTGTSATISWENSLDSPIDLALLQNGERVESIATDLEDTGEYAWMVEPSSDLTGFQIEVSTTLDGFIYRDTSDASFDMQLGNLQLIEVVSDTVHPSFVNVIYRVTTAGGAAIPFLNSLSDYEILEDGSSISETESIPALDQVDNLPFEQRTLLMLDNSFSIGLNLSLVKQAAKEAVRNRFSNQSFAVWTFSEEVEEVQSFTQDTTVLIAAIEGISLGPASTNLYGAVVEGVDQLVNEFDVQGIIQSSMLVMSDGEDTQGSTSELEALNAVADQQVFTIAVGDDADIQILGELGSAGALDGDFIELSSLFGIIQHDIENYANSFYWLVYISPSRNNPSVELQLTLTAAANNPTISVEFSSVGFSSVVPGVYVNRDYNALLGINEFMFTDDTPTAELEAQTLFNLFNPQYSWTLTDPNLVEIVNQGGENNESITLRALISDPFSSSVMVEDTENGYSREIALISEGVSVESEEHISLPDVYAMSTAWPNPFNPKTTIEVSLPHAADLQVNVYNLIGQQVASIASGQMAAGRHRLVLDGSHLSSGLYLVHASVPGQWSESRKVLLMK